MKKINFTKSGNIEKAAHGYLECVATDRRGILEWYNGQSVQLNILELSAIYDQNHVGRSDFFPEFKPRANRSFSIKESKEFWGEYWTQIFGDDGENWGKSINDDHELNYLKVKIKVDEIFLNGANSND